MDKVSFQKFKIDQDSVVVGDGIGHLYCTTTPDHPDAIVLKDRNKKYVPVHRVIMENHLGRLINPEKEEINHKDGNPKNNALSNLKLVSHEEHAREHAHKKKFWEKSPLNKSARRVIETFLNKF